MVELKKSLDHWVFPQITELTLVFFNLKNNIKNLIILFQLADNLSMADPNEVLDKFVSKSKQR